MKEQAAAQAARDLIAPFDPAQFRVLQRDRRLFNDHVASFLPPHLFDFHAHWYDLRQAAGGAVAKPRWVGKDLYREALRQWLGDHAPQEGLFFPMPFAGLDVAQANAMVLEEAERHPQSRCLLLITPGSDPAQVEQQLHQPSVSGFKVYHLFAARPDTQNATPQQYIPEWAWELADAHGLCIMLHLVMRRALAEPQNQHYIRSRCRKYRNARLILAHAARGFCSRHTIEGIQPLKNLDNLYFDTSAVCEPEPMLAVLSTFGSRRLIFGTDFPICQTRGRAVTLGDSFQWLNETTNPAFRDQMTLVGLESLLALKSACRLLRLRAGDLEHICRTNARNIL